MREIRLLLLLLVLCLAGIFPAPAQGFSEAIEDNSFFIEEAYNQERGMVQHIFNSSYFPSHPRDLFLSFTQEWPLPDERNQLSYTLPLTVYEYSEDGLNDLFLNYRRQVLYEDKEGVAFAPRLSLVLPSGNVDKGLGYGTVGVQVNLPFSKRWTEHFATHFNGGFTVFPDAEFETSSGLIAKKTLSTFNTGFSAIWLAHRRFNLLLEFVTNFGSEITDSQSVNRFTQYLINPGLRGSIQWGKVEIVPGISAPLVWTKQNFEPAVFLYLSFEHPFLKGVSN